LSEPDWSETFAGDGAEVVRCRAIASREWQRIVPVLRRSTGLGDVDASTLHDYCVCVARIDQCERTLSRQGLLMEGERGWQKNGATTIAGQYRTTLLRYIGELGLSPSARGKLPEVEEADDGASPFDV
jgi:P27 family predicted phage terminase small subunit